MQGFVSFYPRAHRAGWSETWPRQGRTGAFLSVPPLTKDFSSMSTINTLIIGYGSTLRSDDGVGYVIAETMMDQQENAPSNGHPSNVDVIARHQLTPDLADNLSRVQKVIFIDACADDAPGEIRIREVAPKGENWGAFAHEMSPEVLLDCVKDVFGRLPQAHLITIGGENFAIGEGLTGKVQAAIPKVIELVQSVSA
jgi:hydrogenase maturation protease